MSVSCEERIQSNEYLDLIIDFKEAEEAVVVVRNVDSCSVQVNDQYRVWYGEREALSPISMSTYTYRYIPKLYGLMQDFNTTNLAETGSLRVQRPPLSLTGKRTVIVLIDTGIDYTDPVFQNPDGSTRILAIWDQTLRSGEYSQWTSPEGIPYGVEFKREDINRALRGETDPLPTRTKMVTERQWRA